MVLFQPGDKDSSERPLHLDSRSAKLSPRAQAARSEAALDRELIRRFNGGDERAFNEITTRYRERILTLAERFLHNHADAEEIAQDTFIRAYRGLARFRGESSLATWLHRIAINLARNRYWYFFRRRRHLTCSLDSPLNGETAGTFADLLACGEPGPVRGVTMNELAALVTSCMAQLGSRHREILTLRNELHRSYGEIGSELRINEGTVKSRIARARGLLRHQMAGQCPEFSLNSRARDWLESSQAISLAGLAAAA